jgi:hypothetical protein
MVWCPTGRGAPRSRAGVCCCPAQCPWRRAVSSTSGCVRCGHIGSRSPRSGSSPHPRTLQGRKARSRIVVGFVEVEWLTVPTGLDPTRRRVGYIPGELRSIPDTQRQT